ncbi:Neuropeptide FF receptor 2 [Orchesella cincta]|uniref:Neuropeptide FF receptor 2 n=1 Tax=Orchesella cincta TaxID=48709 RepID=A0A1D2MAK0_ORCCI|nr:Neuropeptide FF receptor 2 [Orchesella cincta]
MIHKAKAKKRKGFRQTPFRLPLWGVAVLITGYISVFLFGLVGNCSVLLVIKRLHRMKTATNYFISNLALADLLVLVFCLLPNLVSNIYIAWILGWFLCKTLPYIQGVTVCASVYSLVAISIERYVTIRLPFRYQITKEKAKKIIIAIWTWSFIVALPWVPYFDTYNADSEHPEMLFCVEKWPDSRKTWSNYYFLFGNFIMYYLLPLGIILICYLTVGFHAYSCTVILSDCNTKMKEIAHQKAKTAVTKTLLVIVFTFALSWLPLYIVTLRLKFGPETKSDLENDVISIIYPIAQWLGYLNSGVNPIVYSFINRKFRMGFYSICKCPGNQRQPLPTSQNRHPSDRRRINVIVLRETFVGNVNVREASMLYDSE